MALVIVGLVAAGMLGGAYALGKYHGKNATLLAVAAEIDKLEAAAKAEEQAIVAKVKALLAKL